MVRQAVVQIMLGPNPQQRHDGFRAGPMLAEGEEGEFHPDGERGGGGQALAHQESTSCPSKCILWCAIALGALVQGCSLEYVSRLLVDTNLVSAAAVNACYHPYCTNDRVRCG